MTFTGYIRVYSSTLSASQCWIYPEILSACSSIVHPSRSAACRTWRIWISVIASWKNCRILNFTIPSNRNLEIYDTITISSQLHRSRTAFPETFLSRRHLKKLNLTGNLLTVVPKALEEAGSLEYLRLDANPIRVIDRLNAFPNLSNLRELRMHGMSNLTAIGNSGLSALTGLEILHVQNCEKLGKIDEYALAHKVRVSRRWARDDGLVDDNDNNSRRVIFADLWGHDMAAVEKTELGVQRSPVSADVAC